MTAAMLDPACGPFPLSPLRLGVLRTVSSSPVLSREAFSAFRPPVFGPIFCFCFIRAGVLHEERLFFVDAFFASFFFFFFFFLFLCAPRSLCPLALRKVVSTAMAQQIVACLLSFSAAYY